MASLHDELAKASALAAFGKFKESPKIEEFRGVLAALWAEHEPLMKEAARSGHPQYEFVCATDYDFSIKEIEEFMLPTAWAALQKAGHTFNWKFDQEIPFRYSFKIRWHRKREDILKRLKEETLSSKLREHVETCDATAALESVEATKATMPRQVTW